MEIEVHEDQKFVRKLLQTSLAISVSLMVIGIALHLVTDAKGPPEVLRLQNLVSGDLSVAQLVLGWGILMLAVTPALRVIALILLWARAKDWVYTAVSVTVLLTLILSIAIGQG